MKKLLQWLDGKKSVIIGSLGAVNTYLIAAGYITAELGALFASLLALTGYGAVVATNQVLGTKQRVK